MAPSLLLSLVPKKYLVIGVTSVILVAAAGVAYKVHENTIRESATSEIKTEVLENSVKTLENSIKEHQEESLKMDKKRATIRSDHQKAVKEINNARHKEKQVQSDIKNARDFINTKSVRMFNDLSCTTGHDESCNTPK